MTEEQVLVLAALGALSLVMLIAVVMSISKIEDAITKISKAIETLVLYSNCTTKPMKPKMDEQVVKQDSVTRTPHCPNCDKQIYEWEKFCPKCGQALDWGDDE